MVSLYGAVWKQAVLPEDLLNLSKMIQFFLQVSFEILNWTKTLYFVFLRSENTRGIISAIKLTQV